MTPEEAQEWIRGERSMANLIPPDPLETWSERVACADAAMMEQAHWALRIHNDALPAGWRPIATAPKDRAILLRWPGVVRLGHWSDDRYAKNPRPYWATDGGWRGKTFDRMNPPTHWQPCPLPDLPEEGEE